MFVLILCFFSLCKSRNFSFPNESFCSTLCFVFGQIDWFSQGRDGKTLAQSSHVPRVIKRLADVLPEGLNGLEVCLFVLGFLLTLEHMPIHGLGVSLERGGLLACRLSSTSSPGSMSAWSSSSPSCSKSASSWDRSSCGGILRCCCHG